MILTATINEVKRRITFDNPQAVVAVKGDYEVNGVAFAFPAIYEDDFDLSTAVKTVYYKATDGIIYNHVVTDTDTDTGYPLWVFKDEINKGAYGDVEFALVCDKVEGGNIVKRWVSMITAFRVQKSIEIDESEQEDNEQTYSERLAYLMTQMASMQATVSGLASGAPTAVSLASGMTDTNKLYVYTGSESGYTTGHWYYYNGSAWADGGQYGGTTVDATLTVSGAAADAKVTGDKIAEIKEDLTALVLTGVLSSTVMSPTFFNGKLNPETGKNSSDTNKVYTGYTLVKRAIRVAMPSNMRALVCFYAEASNVSSFVKSYGEYAGDFTIFPIAACVRIMFRYADDSALDRTTVPNTLVITRYDTIAPDTTLTASGVAADAEATGTAINGVKTIADTALSSNMEALPLVWEQGSLSTETGNEISATNRIRTKYQMSLNSLRYLYVYCPFGWVIGGRTYLQSDDRTFTGNIDAFTGFNIIPHTANTMYRFFTRREDNADITPADAPAILIIPVYKPYWDADAHGKSIATFRTTRNNPAHVQEICEVAASYYDHRSDSTDGVSDMQYGSDSATRTDTYTRQIDCSTFITLLLLGIPYTSTQYYTKADTPASSLVPNPAYAWAVDPRLYDYYPDDLTAEPDADARASQLAEWMIDMGWRVPKDRKLLNLEVGDILFYARANAADTQLQQPDRFMCINHVAICTDKQRNTSGTGFPYTYTFTEVTSANPCVKHGTVETGWDTPDVINVNNYNTLVLICRPDLGSL